MTTTIPNSTRSPETAAMIDLLRDLVEGFTAYHAELQVNGVDSAPRKMILGVRCSPFDHPKLIGSKGKHHRAILSILSTIAARMGREVEFVLQGADRVNKPPDKFRPDPRWDHQPMRALLDRVLAMAFGDGAATIEHRADPAKDFDSDLIVQVAPEIRINDRLEFTTGVDAIFHAIGKTQGRLVHVTFSDR